MKLSIAEGLYLIALDDVEGRLLAAAEKTIIPGLLSAAIFELYQLKKVSLTDTIVKVEDTVGTGNGILDSILHKLKSGQHMGEEIKHLSEHFKDIQVDLDELLVSRGILKREETKLMWIPLSERMDNANYAFEQDIRNVLHAMVFKKAKATSSFAVLLCLIYYCGILDEVFRDKDDMIDAIKVAKDIPNLPSLDPEISKSLKELKSLFGK